MAKGICSIRRGLRRSEMVEPVTTIGLGVVAAYLGKDGVQKLLGPTADYLGGALKEFAQKRAENVGKIFANATQKLGGAIDNEGQVPPKVLKQIIDDGSFANDAIEIDYLGGILASSRTNLVRDNRGASLAKTVDSLSNYQIRAHFLIYTTIKNIFESKNITPNLDGRAKMGIFLPYNEFSSAMQYSNEEYSSGSLLSHIFFGLNRAGLIESFNFGPEDHIKQFCPHAANGGIVLTPSANGIELFLWAFGKGSEDLSYIFSPEFSASITDVSGLVDNSCPVEQPVSE